MLEVEAQVEAAEILCDEEADIVELPLVVLHYIGGGAGNAAMSF